MNLPRIWLLATVVGLVGTVVLFGAAPGVNFVIWTVAAIVGLLTIRSYSSATTRATTRALAVPLGFAILLAAGAAVTTTPILIAAIVAMVACLLALAILLAARTPDPAEYGPAYILTAPIRALGRTAAGTVRACVGSVAALSSVRARPVLRGALIAAPITLAFALMFATADPLFARGRDAITDWLTSWSLAPRLMFGVLLTLFVLGAYSVAAHVEVTYARHAPHEKRASLEALHTGATECTIVLGAVAGVSWLFVLLQLTYIFGNAPAAIGSGVTFAQYARQGFSELAVAATVAGLLIVAANQSQPDIVTKTRALRISEFVLLGAVFCVLLSAMHRVALYEDAYGFTTSRVYAQAYVVMLMAIVLAAACQLARGFDTPQLARQVVTISLATLVVLVYCNPDAWVARKNLDRYSRTGKIDTRYLGRYLSADAYPTLVAVLAALPPEVHDSLARALSRNERRLLARPDRWYEWNLRRRPARSVAESRTPTVSR